MPLQDINRLFARPWGPLARQYASDLRTALATLAMDTNNLHSGGAVK